MELKKIKSSKGKGSIRRLIRGEKKGIVDPRLFFSSFFITYCKGLLNQGWCYGDGECRRRQRNRLKGAVGHVRDVVRENFFT